MNSRYLDMDSYKRKSHFEYFKSMASPYVGLTVSVEITDFFKTVKDRRLPFFLSLCYCVSRAANQVPEFRQRILDGRILQYDFCRSSHTVALDDGTYCYCTLDSRMPFEEYLPYALNAQEEAKKARSAEDSDDALEFLFVSTLPWLSYTSLIQPVPMPTDSNPRITWGKYEEAASGFRLPLSVLCNHALVDGLHISRFYQALDRELAAFSGSLRP